MSLEEMFNWPDADVILRATHGTDSRDFRVHKLFLSFASPVFKDMFKLPQPSSTASSIDTIDMADPPRALEVILHFIYPSTEPPAINDLILLSEVLVLADKYEIRVAQVRLRPSLVEFAKTEPLRVYAIACQLGLEDEMKIASSYTTSIHLPGLTELPDEFKSVPATEYHRLILLQRRYRKAVEEIATSHALAPPAITVSGGWNVTTDPDGIAQRQVLGNIWGDTPLTYESLSRLNPGRRAEVGVERFIRSVFDKANALNLTV